MNNNVSVQINGKDYIIDIAKAKSLGVIKEDATIKDFSVGDVFVNDVFVNDVGNAVIIVPTGYSYRYSIAGLWGDLNVFSDFGAQGATKKEMLQFLNAETHGGISWKFVKNINADFSLLLTKVLKDYADAEALKALEKGSEGGCNG